MADDFLNIHIDISQVVDLAQKMGLDKACQAGVMAAASHIKSVINVYPPSTAANKRGRMQVYARGTSHVYMAPMPWYIRGEGPHWVTKKGEEHSKRTSETLGRKWTISKGPKPLSARVGNNVSYVRFVHDKDMQAGFHAARGWKTAQDVVEQETRKVQQIIEDSIKAEIRRRFGY